MNITSVLRLTFWHSTNSGAQHYPKHSPNTSGTRVEKFGKELLWKQTLSRWLKNRRVRIPQRKNSTRRRWSRPNWWQFPKPQMDKLKFIGGDQVLRTPTLTRYHPSSRRSSRRPSWRIRRVSTNHQSRKSLHINTSATQRSAISSPKLLRKIFGKTCHELLQQADLRRLLQVKQVAIMVPGLSTTSSLSSLSTPTPPTSSTQDVEGSIHQHQSNVRVRIDKHGETRCVTQPIKQCRCKRVSEQVESSWQARGDPLRSIFWNFEDMMPGDADEDCEQVFHVT